MPLCELKAVSELPFQLGNMEISRARPERGCDRNRLWYPPRTSEESMPAAHHAMTQEVNAEGSNLKHRVDRS